MAFFMKQQTRAQISDQFCIVSPFKDNMHMSRIGRISRFEKAHAFNPNSRCRKADAFKPNSRYRTLACLAKLNFPQHIDVSLVHYSIHQSHDGKNTPDNCTDGHKEVRQR